MRRKLSKKQIGAMGLAALMSAQTPAMATETETATEQVLQETQIETATEQVLQETQTETESEATTPEIESEPASFEEMANESDEIPMQTLTEGWNELEDGNFVYVKDGQLVKNQVLRMDGLFYLFDENGYMDRTYLIRSGDTYYYGKPGGGIHPLPEQGWILAQGHYYYSYYRNLLHDTVMKIDGVYYGFYNNCEMVWGTEFKCRNDYYLAKEDGPLYTNEWNLTEPDKNGVRYWNYYGEDAKRCTGLQNINGQYYCFSRDGALWCDAIVNFDGAYYHCASDGKATLLVNGWANVKEDWYYAKDGELVRNCAIRINDAYYGFNDDGKRYVNTPFTAWDEEKQGTYGYRAKEDGTLYENEWYVEDGHSYYYGEEGKAYTGVRMLNGKQYCFSDKGKWYRNTCVCIDGDWYTCAANGEARKLQGTGWIDMDGDYFYVQDGTALSNCTAQINGNYYGFDVTGTLYHAEEFSIDNRETGEIGHYRAREDGSLYENEWYVTEDGNWYYYYGDAGKAYSGLQEMNGKNYYFGYAGQQYRNTTILNDGNYYYCDPDGEANQLNASGWTNLGERRFYVKDGMLLSNCVAEIEGTYFGFSEEGVMYRDSVFTIVKFDEDNVYTYRADKDGALYVKKWYTSEDGKTYYYGEQGREAEGFCEIDGKNYLFESTGEQYRDCQVLYKGENYYCAKNGEATLLSNNRWTLADGMYFYVKDGRVCRDCVEAINGQYYGFRETGAMYAGEQFYEYEFETGIGSYYRAKEDGRLYQNEWYTDISEEEPQYYYYGADAKAYSGLREVDGWLYYFGENGCQYRNTDVTVNGETYYCGIDGTATLLANNSWTKIGENYYYVKERTFLKGCMEEINGSLYCFSENGSRYQNTYVTVAGVRYYCDSEGKATVDSDEPRVDDGWTQIDGDYFYVKDGVQLKDCVEKIDGYYYGFDWSGKMETDRFSIWDEASQNYIQYRAYEDGHLYTNVWCKTEDGSSYYYYGEDGKAYTGVHVINDATYCFYEDGRLYMDEVISMDGNSYYCASDGSTTLLESDQWHLINEKYYYVRNGELLKSCIVQIGQAYYGFRWDGILYQDEEFNQGDGTDTYYYYRAKEDGSLYVNEWYESESSSYYYGEGGRAYRGISEIGGRTCYFNEYGCLCKDQCVTDNDKLYYCDKQGNAALLQDNGWTIVNGTFLYAKDKEIVKDCVIWIDDAYYGFDYNGVMYSNQRLSLRGADGGYHEYRAKKDGKLYQNEWYENQYENQYYYGEDGVALSGWQQIDGKSYFFDFDGRMETNRVINEDGQSYYCGADGVAVKLQENGWTEVDGKYFYANENGLVKDCVMQIDGQYYGFDENGMMYADRQFFIRKWENNTYTYSYYLAGADGVLYTNCWYSKRNGGENWLYYYGADGQKYEGMRTIDGEQYYFDNHLMVNQVVAVDGINYYCNLSGKMTAMSNNSWYQGDDSAWYYVQNDVLLKSRSAKIGGQWYSFDENGKMVTQGANVNPDGSLRVNTWRYDGTYWYYYGSDGMPYSNGFYEIGGATYYFTSGRLATLQMCKDSERTYFADANGNLMQTSQNGWILTGGNYYYIENGEVVNSKVKKIQNAWYAFDWYGKMYADGEYSIWNDDESFRARTDGSLYVSQWYQADTGEWYYYGADALAVSGLVSVNGKMYVFGSDHTLGKNGAVRVNAAYYLADGNGGWVRTPGWNLVGGNWYYVRSDGSLYTGILNDGGHQYYMEPSMATDVEIKNVNGMLYQIDANGYLTVASDGFHYRNGAKELCYVSGGKSIGTGWQNIGGSWYYFVSDKADGFVLAAQSGSYQIDGKWYYFDDEGKRVSNGWAVDKEGTWYYASASGELMTGDAKINGVLYHFKNSGELRSGVIIENGICKLYSKDGALVASGTSRGWNLLGGDYYYMKDGVLLKNGSFCLEDGKWYLFDENGKMLANVEVDERWYGASGAALTGWFKQNGNWYYGNPFDAVTYKGLHRINGAEYYFDQDGVMQTGGAVMNGTALVMDASGAVTGKYRVEDGWSSHGTEWYYYQNGVAYTGWVGAYYVSNGQMQRNQMVRTENNTYYYVGEDGTYQTNAWVNDGKSYAKANGLLAQNEWLKINGRLYYFENWYPEIGEYESTNSDEQTGLYQEDGSFLSAKNYVKGWLFIDGHWYYKDGENFVQNRSKKIDGVWYQFDVYGKMMEN